MVGKGGGTARVMWASAEGPRAVAVTADATILLAALVAALVMASGRAWGGCAIRAIQSPAVCSSLGPSAPSMKASTCKRLACALMQGGAPALMGATM